MTRKVPSHSCLTEHEASRSYQPSSTGIAAYYQAEQSGGLAVCPPLPRVPSTHHLHGEGPAEEVRHLNTFLNKTYLASKKTIKKVKQTVRQNSVESNKLLYFPS